MRTHHRIRLVSTVAAVTFVAALLPLRASENIDYDGVNKIKQQGLSAATSQVMEVMSYLTDVYGPRLTGSPNVKKAADWAVGKMQAWGLTNVAEEAWTPCPADVAATLAAGQRAGAPPAAAGGGGGGRGNNPASCGFPRGWANEKFYLAAVAPQQFPIPGTPTGWTPGTNGLVRADAALVTETTLEQLKEKYSGGKLKGKWVLRVGAPDVAAYWNPLALRYSNEQLATMESPTHPLEFGVTPPGGRGAGGRPGGPAPAAPGQPTSTPCGGRGGANPCDEFLRSEGILGTLSTAPRGHGIYTIGGSSSTNPETSVPAVVIPAEQYGRIARLLDKNMPVTIEADIKNTYYPNPPMFNVVGEIAGTDKADEVVMLGAHFDSWHASTGATDNGAGSGAMMEAMRILKQSGVTLRRTVRIGLWTGEEEGLLGSRDYVTRHFGTAGSTGGRGGGAGAAAAATPPTPPNYTADHAKFAAYFNIDNGTGAIRGVYLQGNEAVAPIFREWMEPFHTIGMTTLTIANTGGTDHQSFDAVNLPGFQFIQDEVEYNAVTHHTNLDSYERLQPEDMRRNATIAAAFAFLAANRDEKLPRKPVTSPFAGGRGGQ
jgi:carboxypeptidase Q